MRIQERRLARFFSLANFLILLIGICVVLIGFLIKPYELNGIELRSVLVNIGCEIIVVAVLFFLGRLLLIDPHEELNERLMRIEKSMTTRQPLFKKREDFNAEVPFTQFLAQGQDVLIMGMSLLSTVGPLKETFRKIARQGTNVRFLLLHPESPCLELAAKSLGISPESLHRDVITSLGHLQELVDSAGDRDIGCIKFGRLKVVPEASIVMRDGQRDTGVIRCELYLYGADISERPSFLLTPADGEWYYRYRDAVERLWTDSQADDQDG